MQRSDEEERDETTREQDEDLASLVGAVDDDEVDSARR